jgi:hypothetical protein
MFMVLEIMTVGAFVGLPMLTLIGLGLIWPMCDPPRW